MSKDTQNAVLVLLSLVVVFVIVIGGGYWCFNYGDGIFVEEAANRTVIPKKKTKVEAGEYSISLEDNVVMILIEKIPKNRDKDIVTDNVIFKTAYARNVVSNRDDYMNIYEYYAYKEEIKDEAGTLVGYRYYSDKEKNNLIAEVTEDINVFEKYSDNLGMYKYSFKYDNRKGYVFEKTEKVR